VFTVKLGAHGTCRAELQITADCAEMSHVKA
jgi:hypothetical protein